MFSDTPGRSFTQTVYTAWNPGGDTLVAEHVPEDLDRVGAAPGMAQKEKVRVGKLP